LLLVWSKADRDSKWIEKEWTNADAPDRNIIPCRLEKIEQPALLANRVYVDFQNYAEGIAHLRHDLHLD
jgi:hypothetical protein